MIVAKNRRFNRTSKKQDYPKSSTKVSKNVAKFVKKEIKKEQEIKFFDTTGSLTQFYLNNAIIQDLCLIPQSAGASTDITRIGDHVKLVGLHLRLIMNPAASNLHHRVILFQWKPNTQLVAPAGANILTYYATADSRSILSNYYNDYENQFTILYDKMWEASNTIEDISNSLVLKLNLRFAKRDLAYYSSQTAGSNHIYMMLVSNAVVGTPSTATYVARVFFSDS